MALKISQYHEALFSSGLRRWSVYCRRAQYLCVHEENVAQGVTAAFVHTGFVFKPPETGTTFTQRDTS